MTRALKLTIALSTIATFAVGAADVADAARRGDKAAVRALVLKKADVNAPQADGSTALHWAVQSNDLELADLLLRAGAKVSAANVTGATPLLLASVNGNATMIGRLLTAGADPNAKLTKSGDTALMMTASAGGMPRTGSSW